MAGSTALSTGYNYGQAQAPLCWKTLDQICRTYPKTGSRRSAPFSTWAISKSSSMEYTRLNQDDKTIWF